MRAVVIGRSNIVGLPVALMLANANATVTICHSRTRDLPGTVRSAEIVVAAVGRAEYVKGDWIKPGAIVIDVGSNSLPDPDSEKGYRYVGDVELNRRAQSPDTSPKCPAASPHDHYHAPLEYAKGGAPQLRSLIPLRQRRTALRFRRRPAPVQLNLEAHLPAYYISGIDRRSRGPMSTLLLKNIRCLATFDDEGRGNWRAAGC